MLHESPFRWISLGTGWGTTDVTPFVFRDPRGWEAHYYNDCERDKSTTRHLHTLPDAVQGIFERLQSRELIEQLSDQFGIRGLQLDPVLHGGGLHMLWPGGWLQTHVDYEVHPKFPHLERRINLVQFLNPVWAPRWGGELVLADASGKVATRILPEPGAVVAFECGPTSFHGVRRVDPKASPRLTAAVYLLAPRRDSAVRTRALFLPNRKAPECPEELA